jgi:predicted cupin superfamily sugar epimerase
MCRIWFNYLHWLAPRDTEIVIERRPVDYYIFHLDGRVETLMLGMDLPESERPSGKDGLGASEVS